MLQREISDLRKTLEEKSIDFERRLKEIKDKMKGLLDSKDIEIRNLNDTNIELRRAMERQQGGRRE